MAVVASAAYTHSYIHTNNQHDDQQSYIITHYEKKKPASLRVRLGGFVDGPVLREVRVLLVRRELLILASGVGIGVHLIGAPCVAQ